MDAAMLARTPSKRIWAQDQTAEHHPAIDRR
jgi:hypothetical protein